MIGPEVTALFPRRLAGVIRWQNSEQAWQAARTAATAGLGSIEIAVSTVGAFELVERLRHSENGCAVGAGTITDAATAQAAIDAGAQYLVTPFLVPPVAPIAAAAGVPLVMGALSPSEIVRAQELGAKLVKVFPAAPVGGPDYVRALRGPLPQVPLWVSGGVAVADCAAYLEAGADVIGLTADLFRPDLMATEDWQGLRELCQRALRAVGASPSAAVAAAS